MIVVPRRSVARMLRPRRTPSCCETEEPGAPVASWIWVTLKGPPRRSSRIPMRSGCASALKNSALNWRRRSASSRRGSCRGIVEKVPLRLGPPWSILLQAYECPSTRPVRCVCCPPDSILQFLKLVDSLSCRTPADAVDLMVRSTLDSSEKRDHANDQLQQFARRSVHVGDDTGCGASLR